jgi:hypothetical protein
MNTDEHGFRAAKTTIHVRQLSASEARQNLGALDGSRLVGTVQIVTALPPNQPHRAEIAKLLVLRSARG